MSGGESIQPRAGTHERRVDGDLYALLTATLFVLAMPYRMPYLFPRAGLRRRNRCVVDLKRGITARVS